MALRLIKGLVALGGVLSLLAACGGGGDSMVVGDGAPPPVQAPRPQAPGPAAPQLPADVAVPDAPAGLSVTYALRSFRFSWSATARATHYEFREDPDGPGPMDPVRLADRLVDARHALENVPLHLRLQAEYSVRACNAGGCSAPATIRAAIADAVGYVKAGNTGPNDEFGAAVALSADGSTMAIGAPGEASGTNYVSADAADDSAPGAGAVYVFVRGPQGWLQRAYLKSASGARDERFGAALALSADGTRLVVGAPGGRGGGSVHIWDRGVDGVWWMSGMLAGATGDSFGQSVALSGDGMLLVVGAPRGNWGNGAVQAWRRLSATAWTREAVLTAPYGDAGDAFGTAVAISADGRTIAVGAPNEFSGATGVHALPQQDEGAPLSGAVYVYAQYALQAFVKASNTSQEAFFGSALALSSDGNILAVGAPREVRPPIAMPGGGTLVTRLRGAAYAFERTGATWTEQALLRGDLETGVDLFGTSVALSADGALLAVGAPDDPGLRFPGIHTGSAHLLRRSGASWSAAAELRPRDYLPGYEGYVRYGQSVAIAADALTFLAGAPGEFRGFTGVNTPATFWDTAGMPVSLLNMPAAGAAYLY